MDEAPRFSLSNYYQSLFPLLRHTNVHKWIYPSSQLARNKFVRCIWKGNAFSFQVFHYSYHLILTSVVHGGRIQLQKRERKRLLLYLSWEWGALTSTMTVCDNSVSHRKYSAISLSIFSGEILGHLEPVMNETSPHIWYIFLISRTNNTDIWNEHHPAKEHRQHNSLGKLEEIDTCTCSNFLH